MPQCAAACLFGCRDKIIRDYVKVLAGKFDRQRVNLAAYALILM
jgi:hypothetical protein